MMSERRAEDGWIEWAGGECPVSNNTRVYVRFFQAPYEKEPVESERPEKAGDLFWDHRIFNGKPDVGNIVAYRVVSA